MILIILASAIFLRLINLNQSLWLDEAITANALQSLNLKSLITTFAPVDFHPPLYYLFLDVWTLIFGYSEIALRMPSVLFGVLTVFIVYLIAKKLFEERTALTSAVLLATAPLHIYYSQEARMYVLAALLASTSVYFFISILKKENIWLWFGFIFSTSLMLYTDYVPYLMIPTYIAFLLLFKKRIKKSILFGFIPVFALILITQIPWVIIFFQQLKSGLAAVELSSAWAQVVGSSSPQNLILTFVKFSIGRISHNNNLTYLLLFSPVVFFTLLMFTFSLLRLSRLRSFLWFWFAIPIVLAFLISQAVPVYSYFRLIFVLPAMYLIWASAINTVNIKKLTVSFLAAALTINLISIFIYYLNPKFQRENWRGAVSYIDEAAGDSSIVLFESEHSIAPFDYYNRNRINTAPALSSFVAERSNVNEKVQNLTQGKDKVFLFQYLSGITDPNGIVFEEITEAGFYNLSTRDFDGVGFIYEFHKVFN